MEQGVNHLGGEREEAAQRTDFAGHLARREGGPPKKRAGPSKALSEKGVSRKRKGKKGS